MDRKELAKFTKKAFDKMLKDTSWKATCGSNKAALNLIKEMTAMELVLQSLGYTTNDNGRLIKYKNYERTKI